VRFHALRVATRALSYVRGRSTHPLVMTAPVCIDSSGPIVSNTSSRCSSVRPGAGFASSPKITAAARAAFTTSRSMPTVPLVPDRGTGVHSGAGALIAAKTGHEIDGPADIVFVVGESERHADGADGDADARGEPLHGELVANGLQASRQ
jgi:hypothetical protein